ncbi:hypothetical protein, partial [Pseudonocardia zijingensis]
MASTGDAQVLARTLNLVEYLAEVTDAAERDPVRDILSDETGAPEIVRWLDELPNGVRLVSTPADDVILRIRPPQQRAEPRIPERLRGWTDSDEPRGDTEHEPRLLSAIENYPEPPRAVVVEFESWVQKWRAWAAEHDRQREVLTLYSELERAAKIMEQQDDAFE